MQEIKDAVSKLDVDDIIQQAKDMGIEVVSNSPYKTHTININGKRVPLDISRHLTFGEKGKWEETLDKLYDAINLLNIIQDNIESKEHLNIYHDAMNLLYEIKNTLDKQ